ncbi:MAG: 1-deoxy-D-xylulose-5-phosphate reductoisomerase [Clostridiales bacterium]|nr:1-deoxy-D-xylulose-5-phosphate reductoisomerase [Clostridiales bacterium]
MKKIAVIGCTGSIGTQALDVIRHRRSDFRVAALSCHKNTDLLLKQVEEFTPQVVGISDEAAYKAVKDELIAKGIRVLGGQEAHSGCIETSDCDTTLISVVGFSGLSPLVSSIRLKKQTCVANKESIVCGGSAIVELCKQHGVELLPVDSEHNAIYQCLMGNEGQQIRKIHLTCSGGPFLHWAKEDIAKATWQQALKHPKWNMGRKISIDSATLANKGLEVLEAKWLFHVPLEKINVVVHPQSIVHSMVEYADGSILSQMGPTDMRIAIQFALTYPKRESCIMPPLDLFTMGELTFLPPDVTRFPCLALAMEAAKAGGITPIAFNAANDVAVEAYLKGAIPFYDIPKLIESAYQRFHGGEEPVLSDIPRMDAAVREYISKSIS